MESANVDKVKCQGCNKLKAKIVAKKYKTFTRFKDEDGRNWYGSYCCDCRSKSEKKLNRWKYYVISKEIDNIPMYYCGAKFGLRSDIKKAKKYARTDKARNAISSLYPGFGFEILKVIKRD